MPYYRRGYYRRGRSGYGYRGYNRSWRRRGWYRRGVSRAQASGNRRFKLVVPVNYVYSSSISGGAYYSTVVGISPFCSNTSNGYAQRCLGNLFTNNSFVAYCKLYDEVKVDWLSVTLECMENIGANVPSVAVFTCLDRRCSYAELNDNSGTIWPSAQEVEGSSSSVKSYMNSSSKRSVHRFFAATDLIEKNQFIDTDYSYSNSVYLNKAFYTAGANPNFFCPCVQYCCWLPTSAPEGGYAIPFSLNIKWGVTFRGPKFSSQAAAASKSVEIAVNEDVLATPVKVSAAGKSVAKSVSFDAGAVSDVLPTYSGLLGDAVDRLAAGMDDPGVYDDGEYNIKEDVEFAYGKLGDEKFHEVFKDHYDLILREIGLISDVSKEA